MLEQRDATASVLGPVEVLIAGFPGTSSNNGGLGWSTVSLVRHGGRNVLIDVGAFAARRLLVSRLAALGLRPVEITDILLTHAHYDHSINWTQFPAATIAIGRVELDWALTHPDDPPLPELYVDALDREVRVVRVEDGDVVAPGITAHSAPGHTPGHLCYVLELDDRDVIFTGDAAKNRAELVSGTVDATLDRPASHESLRWIWSAWRRRPGNVVIPGHDLPMVLDAAGAPAYVGSRSAAIHAWFGDTLGDQRVFELRP